MFFFNVTKIHHGLRKALNAFQVSIFEVVLLRDPSLLNAIFCFCVFVSAFLIEREMTDGRVKKKEGEIKRGGGRITCYCMCYTKLILNCDGRRHLSEAVKVPMNHTALTPFSLSVYLTLSPFGTQPVCATLSLFLCLFFRYHMYLSQSTISDMGCTAEKWSAFVTVFTFIHSSCHMLFYLSRCLYACLFILCLVLPYCWVSSLQLLCDRTNRLRY